eukprot:tig00021348_g20607.t1
MNGSSGTCYSGSYANGTEIASYVSEAVPPPPPPSSTGTVSPCPTGQYWSSSTLSCVSRLLDEPHQVQAEADEGAFDVELDALEADLLTDAFAAEAEFADADHE